ncbi:metallophosphoesterase family protein [Mucilaginibacter sp. X5P1]|uniref:metallophosphoesterase family protein n=1 Tax=Mucilaginibacter sp. X5P1 TaxID=2723088 RepID=UPI0016181F62|nr:metallophosphoesterase [Mucilaginibacter sp. X5P1]MBB6139859.1 calcineurin-like phosphoesterase family protein [Mucilaginibacter sp. X5P1]
MKHHNERGVIRKMALGGLIATPFQKLIVTPVTVQLQQEPDKAKIRFGICANIHQGIIGGGESRLKIFINDMQKQNVDFIIQLGDFCIPCEKNLSFLKIWEHYPGARYHVLGNHDMDGGFTHDQVMAFWKAPYKYYSFDNNGYHFIVLNGNEHNSSDNKLAGYNRYIGKEQQEWLKKDLQHTTLPTILFCHQRLDNNSKGIENAAKIRLILERANQNAGFKKVRLVFSAHHVDHQNEIKGIFYIQVNSVSYQWLGNTYVKFRYSIEIDKKYPDRNYTMPYKDPVHTRTESECNTFHRRQS